MSDNTEIKVSVIIPVYNAENYLKQCLESIINQTLREIEIICVDDGSTDGSLEILRFYQDKDSRVQVYTQSNQYAGVARNTGIQYARGKYLIFWDCDDYFELHALETLYKQSEEDNAQICVCGARRYDEELGKSVPCPGYLKEKMIPERVPFNMQTNNDYILNFTCEAAWNKLYLRSFVEDAGIRFQSTRNGNDLFFTSIAFCLADRITLVRQALVTYRRNRSGSLVNTVDKDSLGIFHNWYDVKIKLEELNIVPFRSFDNRILSVIVYQLNLSQSLDSFFLKVGWLKNEGLALFGLEQQEGDFYYVEWHKEFLDILLNNEPIQVLFWLQNYNYHHATLLSDNRRYTVEKLRNSQAKLESVRMKVTTQKEKLEKQKDKIDKQSDKIQSQKEIIQSQKQIMNLPLVRLALKIYKLFKKI